MGRSCSNIDNVTFVHRELGGLSNRSLNVSLFINVSILFKYRACPNVNIRYIGNLYVEFVVVLHVLRTHNLIRTQISIPKLLTIRKIGLPLLFLYNYRTSFWCYFSVATLILVWTSVVFETWWSIWTVIAAKPNQTFSRRTKLRICRTTDATLEIFIWTKVFPFVDTIVLTSIATASEYLNILQFSSSS